MDTPAKTIVPCSFCGAILATKLNGHIDVKGQHLPTEGLDGVILKCICGRLKTYYLRPEKPVKSGLNPNHKI